jgi:hypothetical protein
MRFHSQRVTWEFIDIPAAKSLLQPRRLGAFLGLGRRSDSKEEGSCGMWSGVPSDKNNLGPNL